MYTSEDLILVHDNEYFRRYRLVLQLGFHQPNQKLYPPGGLADEK
jgi:hypothetical protein